MFCSLWVLFCCSATIHKTWFHFFTSPEVKNMFFSVFECGLSPLLVLSQQLILWAFWHVCHEFLSPGWFSPVAVRGLRETLVGCLAFGLQVDFKWNILEGWSFFDQPWCPTFAAGLTAAEVEPGRHWQQWEIQELLHKTKTFSRSAVRLPAGKVCSCWGWRQWLTLTLKVLILILMQASFHNVGKNNKKYN